MQRTRAGHQPSTDRLVQRLLRVVERVRARLARHRHQQLDPDELAQDTLMALWCKLHRFDGSTSIEAWAWGFASVQQLKAAERARSRSSSRAPLETELAEEDETPPPVDEYARLHECIAELKRTQAIIVRLIHFDDRTFAEVAEHLSLPRGTVKTKYYRAIERLRRTLLTYWSGREE